MAEKILKLLFVFSWLVSTHRVFACSGNEDNPKNSLPDAFSKAKFAFIGRVETFAKEGKDTKAEFQVVKEFKGPLPERLTFKLETGRSCDLGKYVQSGSEWFILANASDERILTASHSRVFFDSNQRQNFERELQALNPRSYIYLNGYRLEEENSAWFACEADQDCVNVSYTCAENTVNKKFLKQADELYRNQDLARDCEPPSITKDTPPFKVFCKNNKCGSQGRNPKRGL